MPMTIDDPDTHTLAQKLAGLTGASLTDAVKDAIREKLARIEKAQNRVELADELDRIAIRCAGRTRRGNDDLTDDEILGYDEIGLPK